MELIEKKENKSKYQEFLDILKNIPKNDLHDIMPLEKFLETNISNLDNVRVKMRELFKDNNIVVEIKQFGKVFDIKWNMNMDKCTIVIPSRYQIEIDQSLLLDLYSNKFLSENKEKEENNSNLEKIATTEQQILTEGYEEEQQYEEDDYDKITNEVISMDVIDKNPNKIRELLELYYDIDIVRNFLQKALSLTRKEVGDVLKKYLPKLNLTDEECEKYGITKYKRLYQSLLSNSKESGRGLHREE
jgi:hypothetical protein